MAEPAIEIVPNRLYWQSFRGYPEPQQGVHFFSTDDLLVYDPYYGDFGPLNTSQLVRFMRMLNDKMRAAEAEKKKIVYFCRANADTRANSALLISAWNMVYRDKTPTDAFAPFGAVRTPFVPFRDASLGPPLFNLTIQHCLAGLHKAIACNFIDPDTFDCEEYEYYERVENGDFNWVVPGKFLAFSGPTQTPISYVDGVKTNTPETYFEYFRENNVTAVIRFNNKVYDRKKFLEAGTRARPSLCPPRAHARIASRTSARGRRACAPHTLGFARPLHAGFDHVDLYFADGSNPTDPILKRFMETCEHVSALPDRQTIGGRQMGAQAASEMRAWRVKLQWCTAGIMGGGRHVAL
jgi:cell division cycle 14